MTRASEARGEFVVDDGNADAVRDLCTRLDGIPLALELAAAQTLVMSPAEISRRLDRQFRLLTGGQHNRLGRHQTLRAAIDWSYDLLTDDERALLDRLSVCISGFDLDAVAAMAASTGADEFDAIDLLRSLVAKSLVERTERDGATRYRMLEMIRQYAGERLDQADGAGAARDDHADHYLALAISLFQEMRTERDYEALARLELETPNITAALRWLLANDRIAELMAFYGDVSFVDGFTIAPSALDDLAAVADEVMARADVEPGRALANACWFASWQRFVHGDMDRYRELGHYAERFGDADERAFGFVIDAVLAMFAGEVDEAASIAAHAVECARRGGDVFETAWTLGHQAAVAASAPGDPDALIQAADEALALVSRTGSHIARLYPLAGLMIAAQNHDPERALEAADELMRTDATRRRWWTTIARSIAMMIRSQRGDLIEGLRGGRDVLQDYHRNGERFTLAMEISWLAELLAPTHPAQAIKLGAVAETDTIASAANFRTQPLFDGFAGHDADAIASARARAAAMNYDDAMDFVLATVDSVIADLENVRTSGNAL